MKIRRSFLTAAIGSAQALVLALILFARPTPVQAQASAVSPPVAASAAGHDGQAPKPRSLCASDELTLFSCALEKNRKIVSVCASEDLSGSSGYMQFRYGRNPASIDLSHPKGLYHPRRHFKYFFEEVPRGETSAISFHIGQYRYSLFKSSSVHGFDGAGVILSMKDDKRVYRRFAYSKCDDETIQVLTGWKTAFRNFILLGLNLPNAAGDISYISAEADADITQPKPGEPERKR